MADLMAGRELDERIRAAMFGAWDERRCRVCGWTLDSVADSDSGCRPGNCSMRPAPDRRADEPLPYSTDIAAAWLVVEHLRAQGYGITLTDEQTSEDESPHWWCEFWNPVTTRSATTAPHAICLAALELMRTADSFFATFGAASPTEEQIK